MAIKSDQDRNEPRYPKSQQECDEYCNRLVSVLSEVLSERLVSVLLSGSWATGDPGPESDIDLTIVVDRVDRELLRSLSESWSRTEAGYVNVYGLDEVSVMSREALHMYTVNSVLLHGVNPFPEPCREDYAADLAATAETVARMARNLSYAWWLTEEEIEGNLSYLLGKNCLRRALQNLAAFRTGIYPGKKNEHQALLLEYPEHELIEWLNSKSPEAKILDYRVIAERLNTFAAGWFREIGEFRKK